jgi:6-phosphogluconolactonase (cycloisomerase 2 family)
MDAGGDHAYVTGLNWVMVHDVDSVSGSITPVAIYVDGVDGIDGISGAHAVALTPVGNAVFVSGSFDNAIASFERDDTTGLLNFTEAAIDGLGGVDGLANARGIAVSPDSRYLYVAGMDDDAISIFAISSTLFTSGFESGNTSGWSATGP